MVLNAVMGLNKSQYQIVYEKTAQTVNWIEHNFLENFMVSIHRVHSEQRKIL